MFRVRQIKCVITVERLEALEQFYFEKRQGISEQTQIDYNQQVKQFFKHYPDSFESPENLKYNTLHYLGQDDIRPCTFNNRLVYLRTFLKWCEEQSIIESNPLKSIKKR
ncbi:hypothetical protein AB4Z17_18945 [Paenibacillus sp. TAF43_2]|uniref:hypothetical protein n=1 Tax=Paenibacillus sp. TAF43_2 TaxID=3233069 RepID=UPI003F9C63D7